MQDSSTVLALNHELTLKLIKGVKEMMELIIEHSKNTKREIMLQPELSAKLIHGH